MDAAWYLLFASGTVCLAWYFVRRRRLPAAHAIPGAVVVLLLPTAFAFGALYGSISSNLCYSSVVGSIAESAIDVLRSGDTGRARQFEQALRALPLWGYETECVRVRAAVDAWMVGAEGR